MLASSAATRDCHGAARPVRPTRNHTATQPRQRNHGDATTATPFGLRQRVRNEFFTLTPPPLLSFALSSILKPGRQTAYGRRWDVTDAAGNDRPRGATAPVRGEESQQFGRWGGDGEGGDRLPRDDGARKFRQSGAGLLGRRRRAAAQRGGGGDGRWGGGDDVVHHGLI